MQRTRFAAVHTLCNLLHAHATLCLNCRCLSLRSTLALQCHDTTDEMLIRLCYQLHCTQPALTFAQRPGPSYTERCQAVVKAQAMTLRVHVAAWATTIACARITAMLRQKCCMSDDLQQDTSLQPCHLGQFTDHALNAANQRCAQHPTLPPKKPTQLHRGRPRTATSLQYTDLHTDIHTDIHT